MGVRIEIVLKGGKLVSVVHSKTSIGPRDQTPLRAVVEQTWYHLAGQ